MVANKKVLLTGASGFVGAHVLDTLLKAGYTVLATVRSQKKADQIIAKYPQYKSHLEFAIVEDVSAPHALDNHVKDVSGIFHTASPVKLQVKSNKADLLDPAILGTQSVLESAALAPSVKRVVITSSFVAIFDPSGATALSHVYSEKDWNPITYELAESTPIGALAYFGSKTFAEKAAWEFLETKKPGFDIVTINPAWVFGPFIHHIDSLDDLNESTKLIYELTKKKELPTDFPGYFVDVRDVAQAHLAAFETPKASNQRYLTAVDSFDYQQVADIIHKNFPGQTDTPIGNPGVHPEHGKVDNSKIQADLGLKFRTAEEVFRDTVASFLSWKPSQV